MPLDRQRTRGWRRTIHLKYLLVVDDSAEVARRVAGQIAERLRHQPEYDSDSFDDFSQLVDEFQGIADSMDADYDESLGTTEHVNDCLSSLYDWADAERVWIG